MKIGLFVYCETPCGGGTGNPSPTRVYDKFVYMELCVTSGGYGIRPYGLCCLSRSSEANSAFTMPRPYGFMPSIYAKAKLIVNYPLSIVNLKFRIPHYELRII